AGSGTLVADRQLAGDHEPADHARGRRARNLVEQRGDDPTVRHARGPVIARGDRVLAHDPVAPPPEPHAEAVGARGRAAEAANVGKAQLDVRGLRHADPSYSRGPGSMQPRAPRGRALAAPPTLATPSPSIHPP